jgi:uncharacterized protein (DUF4415 family)
MSDDDRPSRPRGRPPMPPDTRKERISFRFAPDIIKRIRDLGKGYQAKIEQIIRDYFD